MAYNSNELPNVIRSGGDVEYESMPDGMNYVGLVNIKLVERKAFRSDEREKCYRFVFRSRTNPACYLNHDCKCVWGPRANLFKTLQLMTDFALKEADSADVAFDTMRRLVGKWYKINVIGKPWISPDGEEIRFTRIVANYAVPDPSAPKISCLEWFKENYKNKSAVRQPSQQQQTRHIEPSAEPAPISGFEGMPDAVSSADDDLPF